MLFVSLFAVPADGVSDLELYRSCPRAAGEEELRSELQSLSTLMHVPSRVRGARREEELHSKQLRFSAPTHVPRRSHLHRVLDMKTEDHAGRNEDSDKENREELPCSEKNMKRLEEYCYVGQNAQSIHKTSCLTYSDEDVSCEVRTCIENKGADCTADSRWQDSCSSLRQQSIGKYRCGECGKRFAKRVVLKQHLIMIHLAEKKLLCTYCKRRFKYLSALTQHHRIHTGEKPFQCDVCLKRFRQQAIVDQHRRVHTGERPYQCTDCPKKFKQKATLDQHRRIHTGEKPFHCLDCNTDFRQKSILDKHERESCWK